MTYGACYNATGSRCSGRPQPGMLALRDVVRVLFPGIGDLGIYVCRPVRGGGSLSTHGEGRGWDAKCNAYDPKQRAAGDRLAAALIANAEKLGVQRIIWNRRQWDIRSKAWRPYGGVSPHTDHLHIELCWAAARDKPLTEDYVRSILEGEEDELTGEEKKRLEAVEKAVYVTRSGVRYEHLNIVEAMLKGIGDKLGLKFNDDGSVKTA